MANINKNSLTAIVLGAIAVISSFINVWNWFFWIFAIIGIYFGIRAIRDNDKKFAWIGVGLCVLSFVTYACVRYWPENTCGEEEVVTEQDERDYQQAVDEANHWDVTEDNLGDSAAEPAKDEQKEEEVKPDEQPSPEPEPEDKPAPKPDDQPTDDPENLPIFE